MRETDLREHVHDPLLDFLRGKPEIERSERHILVHGRHEELVVGVLKHHPDGTPNRGQASFS